MATLASSSHLPPIQPSQPPNSLNPSALANIPTYLLAQAPPTPAPLSVTTPKTATMARIQERQYRTQKSTPIRIG